MTPQRAKELLPIIQAFAEGKTVQLKLSSWDDWKDYADPNFSQHSSCYRIKPEEPTFRPWKPEEVPVGALIKWKNGSLNAYLGRPMLILCYNQQKAGIQFYDGLGYLNSHDLLGCLKSCEHSLDGGKTWLPCGVLE